MLRLVDHGFSQLVWHYQFEETIGKNFCVAYWSHVLDFCLIRNTMTNWNLKIVAKFELIYAKPFFFMTFNKLEQKRKGKVVQSTCLKNFT